MAIKSRNKISAEFSTASMSDLVFLLLIFFMLTSTLVSPNAIKLLLPSSSSKTMAKQSLTVYIDATNNYFVEETPVNPEFLVETIGNKLQGQHDASVVLRADQSVPVQYVVTLIDAVNQVNELTNTRHKVILATKPAK
ncbi:Biopolymer transport protein ExbD/TolR [anaerobic digester metagenome]